MHGRGPLAARRGTLHAHLGFSGCLRVLRGGQAVLGALRRRPDLTAWARTASIAAHEPRRTRRLVMDSAFRQVVMPATQRRLLHRLPPAGR